MRAHCRFKLLYDITIHLHYVDSTIIRTRAPRSGTNITYVYISALNGDAYERDPVTAATMSNGLYKLVVIKFSSTKFSIYIVLE